jgi:asparagine synthase (glutamine-hydrolysing)
MCGIVAVLSPRQSLSLAALLAMTRALRHRGPDDEGYLADAGDGPRLLWGTDTPDDVRTTPTASRPTADAEARPDQALRVGLGHRRLAIVDLSPQGHQPMQRGDVSVVFNGEIYDHVERRAELEALGHRFESHSDTEVLIAAWRQWGTDAFRRLNGMWAMALYDQARRVLVLARDRYGVKPLYWWQGEGGELALASEAKALLAHPRIAARVDPAACVGWLATGPQAWQAETLFDGIRSFPAGHWAEVSVDAPAPLTPRSYWDGAEVDTDALAAPFDPAQAMRLAEEYRALLQDAVRVRMRVDVRFGTALSGGLDSSQIALLVNRELRARGVRERQEVFSSVYPAANGGPLAAGLRTADESAYIASVAGSLDVQSNVIEPRWEDIAVEHEHMVWALDTPPINSLMSSWHTYALVAGRGVVVTLDGQGADEQLAGYVYYARNLIVQSGTSAALGHALALGRRMQGVGGMIGQGLAGHLLRRVLGQRGLENMTARLRRGRNLAMPLADALQHDFRASLQTLLFYADKTSMAWSIESRMPFMDWRLVNFLASVPLAYRIHDGWTKWLARHAMRDALPAEVVWRRDKLGWAIPEASWFGEQGPLREWLDGQLRDSTFAQEVAAAAGLPSNGLDLAHRLRLLNLAVWHRLYFEEPGRPGRALGRRRRVGVA